MMPKKHNLFVSKVKLDGKDTDILIENGLFKAIRRSGRIQPPAGVPVLDGRGKAVLPALYNTHNHAAMTLLRGYADDMPLGKWLTEYIWPFEDKMTPADIRKGSVIACEEMKRSGSVFFSDMYFEIDKTISVVADSGMRAAIGITVMDNHSKSVEDAKLQFIREWKDPTGGRIQLAMAPHAIYTVNTERLKRSVEFARNAGIKIHMHLAETANEVRDCLKSFGKTPVRYLESIGVLGPDLVLAHCVHVDRAEWDILASHGVTVSHCPSSNMKLGSGRFPYEYAIQSGCRVSLGTDGASSNNNLDLRQEMRSAAMLAKCVSMKEDGSFVNEGNPELLPAEKVFEWATRNGALAFGIDGGEIAEGKVADAILVDLANIRMKPCFNLISNFVYSADSSCIAATICDGKII